MARRAASDQVTFDSEPPHPPFLSPLRLQQWRRDAPALPHLLPDHTRGLLRNLFPMKHFNLHSAPTL